MARVTASAPTMHAAGQAHRMQRVRGFPSGGPSLAGPRLSLVQWAGWASGLRSAVACGAQQLISPPTIRDPIPVPTLLALLALLALPSWRSWRSWRKLARPICRSQATAVVSPATQRDLFVPDHTTIAVSRGFPHSHSHQCLTLGPRALLLPTRRPIPRTPSCDPTRLSAVRLSPAHSATDAHARRRGAPAHRASRKHLSALCMPHTLVTWPSNVTHTRWRPTIMHCTGCRAGARSSTQS